MVIENLLKNDIFKVISKTAKYYNQECYVIGGYVRDILLNIKEPKDIDIVVIGDGIEFAKKISEALSLKQDVKIFKNFGTSMISYKDLEVEFVGARKESYNRNSRNPSIEPGTLIDDQNRRDFTINTIAISLNEKNFGKIIDPLNGLYDLKKKVIKTPLNPDITYSDDPLRMLRAIRIASQLNFKIDFNSFEAIKKNKNRISILSKERITEELNKILLSEKPSLGFFLLDDCNLLELILPELISLKGIEIINNKGHKDNFYHTLEVVDNLRKVSDNLWLLWASLLHDIGKSKTKKFHSEIGWTFHSHEIIGSKMVPEIFERLKLPLNEKMKYIQKLIKMSSRAIPLAEKNVSDSAIRRFIFESGNDLEDLLLLSESDITTKNEQKLSILKNNYKLIRKKILLVEERDEIKNLKIPINGEDIMSFLKIPPGKEIGIIKQKIKDAILDGVIKNNYDDAHHLMLILSKEMGLK